MTGLARYQITSQHNDDTMIVNEVKIRHITLKLLGGCDTEIEP